MGSSCLKAKAIWRGIMLGEFLIAFRETLEAALIVGIVLTFLYKTGQTRYNKTVWLGILLGVLASIAGAFIFSMLFGEFEGTAEQLFESITMLFGAFLISTVIFWMMKHHHAAQEIEENVGEQIVKGGTWGILLLVFVSILREGIETVIFLQGASFASAENSTLGIALGIALAIGVGCLVFSGTRKVNLAKFFSWSSILLILFAAGLFVQGVHELEEAGVADPIIAHVWDLNPPQNRDGSYPLLHENGHIGHFFKDLFGYSGSPSLLEVISYFFVLALSLLYWKKMRA